MTLIEVLIAVLVLVIGMLGMAAMQLQSVKFSESAKWRSHATFLAYDIVERIRANKARAADYVHTAGSGSPSASSPSVADIDLYEWLQQLALIKGEEGSSVLINGKVVTVVISINDLARTKSDAEATTFTYTTLLD
jgi:type IV pilus assembly protein PilV